MIKVWTKKQLASGNRDVVRIVIDHPHQNGLRLMDIAAHALDHAGIVIVAMIALPQFGVVKVDVLTDAPEPEDRENPPAISQRDLVVRALRAAGHDVLTDIAALKKET